MKYISQYLVFLIILGTALTSAAGQSSRPGFLITLEGDTISGGIRTVPWTYDPDRINRFIVVAPDGTEKTWEGKDIFQYVVGQTLYDAQPNGEHFYAKVWPHNGLREFLSPQVDGRAQLFTGPDPKAIIDMKKNANRVVYDSRYVKPETDTYYVSSPGTALVILVDKDNYDLVLKQVLKDCPELTEKIGEKKFKFNNLEKILIFYNESCE